MLTEYRKHSYYLKFIEIKNISDDNYVWFFKVVAGLIEDILDA